MNLPKEFPKKIAVLAGGPGSERDVSMATARGVSKALRTVGAEVDAPAHLVEGGAVPGTEAGSKRARLRSRSGCVPANARETKPPPEYPSRWKRPNPSESAKRAKASTSASIEASVPSTIWSVIGSALVINAGAPGCRTCPLRK